MPSIVFVDDRPDDVTRFVESLAGRAECKAVHPQDLTIEDLASASLVLIDSRLEDWPERDALPQIALKPLDGKALAAVLRGHAEGAKQNGLTAFALEEPRATVSESLFVRFLLLANQEDNKSRF